jgi:hypothetical protein
MRIGAAPLVRPGPQPTGVVGRKGDLIETSRAGRDSRPEQRWKRRCIDN